MAVAVMGEEPPFVSVVDRAAAVIKAEAERWGPGQYVSYARALAAAGLLIKDDADAPE